MSLCDRTLLTYIANYTFWREAALGRFCRFYTSPKMQQASVRNRENPFAIKPLPFMDLCLYVNWIKAPHSNKYFHLVSLKA